ncbi:hypothetical protein V6N13_071503 [Hibiscus sabdariffa]|uniref:Uncharacterized protein n=1 Tax=Hibiscus sabdariffa TaxID=183260 RepID=A0ABR2TDK5_9ROSI
MLVPSGSYPPSPKDQDIFTWESWCHRCRLPGLHPRVPNCGDSRVGQKCEQRSESEENHSQGIYCLPLGVMKSWRWCHPSHPQVPNQQKFQRVYVSHLN